MRGGVTGSEPGSLPEDARAVGSVSRTGPTGAPGPSAGAAAEASTGATGTADQVDLARDWLRGHGVEAPEVEPQAAGRARTASRSAHDGAPGPGSSRRSRRHGDVDRDGDRPSDETSRDSGESDLGGAAEDAGHGEGVGTGGTRRESRGGRRRSSTPGGSRGRGAQELDPDADPEEVARTIVLRKLSAQARTRVELERALKTRAVPEEAANAVLDRMSEVGLVDDAAFAHDWVASRQQRRHLSRTALRRELTTKGVDRGVIDEALVGVDGSDEHSAALALAQRRAAPMAGLPREVAYRRLGGMLARRGFSGSVTTQVLGEVLGGWTED